MSSYAGYSTGASADNLLAELEVLFGQEETALLGLERLVSEERRVLFGPEPREVLDLLQTVEEVVARIRRLESDCSKLTALIAGTPGGTSAMSRSTPGLVELRSRILKLIARIAEYDEANAHLVAGLARAGKTRLSKITGPDGAEPSGVPSAHRLGGMEKGTAAFNISA